MSSISGKYWRRFTRLVATKTPQSQGDTSVSWASGTVFYGYVEEMTARELGSMSLTESRANVKLHLTGHPTIDIDDRLQEGSTVFVVEGIQRLYDPFETVLFCVR